MLTNTQLIHAAGTESIPILSISSPMDYQAHQRASPGDPGPGHEVHALQLAPVLSVTGGRQTSFGGLVRVVHTALR